MSSAKTLAIRRRDERLESMAGSIWLDGFGSWRGGVVYKSSEAGNLKNTH